MRWLVAVGSKCFRGLPRIGDIGGYLVAVAFLSIGFTETRLLAAPPEVTTIVQKMRAALDPSRPSTRKVVITVRSEGESAEWTAYQARKEFPAGKRILTVILDPESVKGVALLIWEQKGRPEAQWMYLPVARRVRKIGPVSAYESFLNTDFTYYDLGFIGLHDRGFTYLGEETHTGVKVYKVQEVPSNPFYYSRVLAWIAADTFLPIQRDYYDPANALWKTERFEDRTVIDGVPTVLRMVMEDKQAGTSSELRVSDVRYDAKIPDELFDPTYLPKAASHPVWQSGQP